MIYLQLYWEFFKTGLFAVGGGMATIPFLREISLRTGWFTPAMLADMIAVSESTPGPIGVNMATYVGYTVGGVPGAVVATLGIVSPCIVIILIIASFLDAFRSSPTVDRAFYGIRPAGAGILSAVRLPQILLLAVIWILTNLIKPLKKLHPLVFIAFSAAVGILLSM